MKPYYQDAQVTLYHGDCREILPTLEVKCDGVVTDPPYGIGFKYASHDDSPEGYGAFVWSVLDVCESRCSPGSPLFVWQAMLNIKRFAEWFPRDWRLFAAAKNFVQMRPTAMQFAWDPVVVWWTPGKPWFLKTGAVNRDWHVANSASLVSDTKSPQRHHPCPRPLDQVLFIIEQWVRPDGVVLDPFAGSSTTLAAAKEAGRKAIGIEIEERYCEIAAKRCAQEVLDFGRRTA